MSLQAISACNFYLHFCLLYMRVQTKNLALSPAPPAMMQGSCKSPAATV